MRATVVALSILLAAVAACGPVAGGDGSTMPGEALDRMGTLDGISAFVHDAAAKAPPLPPAKPPEPRFALPARAPRGAPLTVPTPVVAAGQRRTVTVTEHWSVDEGKTWHDERYVVAERILDLRNGRAYRTSLDVLEAVVRPPPPSRPSEAPPRGGYLRLAEPIMLGDAGANEQFIKLGGHRSAFGLPILEPREQQTLYDISRVEGVVDGLVAAARQQPLRVGETIDLSPYIWTMNFIADRIHRAADQGPLARYLLTSDGSRRATLTVDAHGRPASCRLEFYSAVTDLTYEYAD